MAGTFFVGGIHGVGKSTAAEALSKHFEVPHYTASKIIKEMKESITWDNKFVSNVAANQQLLITGIQKILAEHNAFILDGHFTLLNKVHEIIKINEEIFQQLSLSGILLLIESPEVIYDRLVIRDRTAMPLNLIAKHQQEEEAYAEYIADTLAVPIHKVRAWTEQELFEVYNKFIKKKFSYKI